MAITDDLPGDPSFDWGSKTPSVSGTRTSGRGGGSAPSGGAATDLINSIRNKVIRTTPEQAREFDRNVALVSRDTVVSYYNGQPITIGWLVDNGHLDSQPTGSEWAKQKPRILALLANQSRGSDVRFPGAQPRSDFAWQIDAGLQQQQEMDSGASSSSRGGGGGGGGGGGSLGPLYTNPDPAQVRDYVKSYVVATTGKSDDKIIAAGVEAFLAADRAGFDSEDQAYDPATAMKNAVRGTEQYKAVHQRRPDSVDEMDWVTSRQGQLRQLGLSASLAEQVGIQASIGGASSEAVQGAGEVAQVGATGRLLQEHRERLKQQAIAVAGLI